ncbi:DUF6331 family protein [Sandaracinus amylolyticus]|uniref:DUF6331 family protein n=1 Tax=Sandaracinus amylolyticus TaxID=927083 RepID=UPI001F3AC401|nr:DUF6331 family protein [Sandaracinus amylolyticus]UJR80230.1 Hypothetical protein I5071_22740 [Sandaracinus amylolyticus]
MRGTLEGLFFSAVRRVPDELERDRLDEIAALVELDESGAIARGLEALVAGVDAEGEADDRTSSWAWLLREIATHVAGTQHVGGEREETLRIDRTGRSLRLDFAANRWSTGTLAERARTVWLVDHPEGHALELDEDARGLLRACEVHCVAGCCGIDAFEIAPVHMRAWIDEVGRERAKRLAQALRDAVVATERLIHVRSEDLNARFIRIGECARHLARWAAALDAALAPR